MGGFRGGGIDFQGVALEGGWEGGDEKVGQVRPSQAGERGGGGLKGEGGGSGGGRGERGNVVWAAVVKA